MLVIIKFRAYVGILLCLIASISPMLKVPFKGSWNLYQLDARLFFITYGIIAVCLFFFVIRRLGGFRLMVIVLFVWYFLCIGAVYFKVNNYFNFKLADKLLAKTLHFQWGWVVLFLGIVFLLFSVKSTKVVKEIN